MDMPELFLHQQKIVDEFPKRICLVWETGTGKSLASMCLANKTQKKYLIICPKSLKLGWILKTEGLPATVMTKEEFRRDWETVESFDCVVVDEAHYFFGMKSQMSKALEKYMKKNKVTYRYFLTATPYGSTPWDVYRMIQLLGFEISWATFDRTFFYSVRMGGRVIPVAKPNIEGKLTDLLKKYSSIVRFDECIDVPPQIFETEYFELTSEQRKAIESIDDVLSITKYGKIHQICGGSLKGDGYVETKHFKSDKFDRAIELCRQNKKIMVICRYNNEISNLKDELAKVMPDRTVYVINGEISGDERHQAVTHCDSLDSYVLLVNASCSEGYQVPSCPVMVFYSYDFKLRSWIQMKGRILRIDRPKKNLYISLVVKGTIDESVFNTVTVEKNDFHMHIYCANVTE